MCCIKFAKPEVLSQQGKIGVILEAQQCHNLKKIVKERSNVNKSRKQESIGRSLSLEPIPNDEFQLGVDLLALVDDLDLLRWPGLGGADQVVGQESLADTVARLLLDLDPHQCVDGSQVLKIE